jgi:hypothetical protein
MALISDPTVVAFCNQVVRPIADRMVGMKATIDIEAATWTATINPILAGFADGDTIDDGADQDGRTVLTKSDIVDFVTEMNAFKAQLDAPGVFDTVNKPKVNTLMP